VPTVLVIDSDPAARADSADALRHAGLQVDTAASAGHGLALASAGGFDVIVLDVRLLDVTGRRLLTHMVDRRMARPVVIVTGVASVRTAVEAITLAVRGEATPATGRVLAVLQAIHRRYQEPRLTIATIARDLHLSPGHLAHLLKHETGRGFLTHLHRTRVREAAALLTTTALSVKEIAGRVGYSRTSRFDVHFRRYHGVTPTAFRTQRQTPLVTAATRHE
jgi:AraC-like DNA-binding protein